jgi:hypothetical protein
MLMHTNIKKCLNQGVDNNIITYNYVLMDEG